MAGRGSRHHIALDRPRWQRVRRVVLDAANWRCAQCGKYAREVDHVIPLFRGGAPYDMDNLQTLCGGRDGCHARKTASENRRPPTPAEAAWAACVAELLPHQGA